MARRLHAMGQPRYSNGFAVTLQPDVVDAPLRWRQPRMIFVNSMSDLFHEAVPAAFIARCFAVMRRAEQHTFQVLTKRPARAAEFAEGLLLPRNVWLGTSVESARYVDRIKTLATIPAAVRFLSLEPLLGPIPRLPLDGIDWVIVGGESGPGARAMKGEWVLQIRDQCVKRETPFFFKQWGGVHKGKAGRSLEGRTWSEFPLVGANSDDAQGPLAGAMPIS
jgi:protein gp37